MAQVTPLPTLTSNIVLRQELGSLLGAGNNFFSSLFLPNTSKNDGKTTSTTAKATSAVAQTTPIAPVVSTSPTKETVQTTPTSVTASSKPTISKTDTVVGSPQIGSTVTSLSPIQTSDFPTSIQESGTYTSATLTMSGISSPTAGSSLSHGSKAGPIAAGVTIAITIVLAIALLVLFYVRNQRKREIGTWKRISRSPSLFTNSSSRGTVIAGDQRDSQSSQPVLTAPQIIYTPDPKRLLEDDASFMGSIITSRTSVTFQKPTLIYVGPIVKETDHRRSPSLESGLDDTEVDHRYEESDDEPILQNHLNFPSSLVPGRKPVPGRINLNGNGGGVS
jgi:hypothetical protein